MSLIQDALKKVQDERDKIQSTDKVNLIQEETDTVKQSSYSKKRFIIIASILFTIVVLFIFISLMFKTPEKINNNKVLKMKNFSNRKLKIRKNDEKSESTAKQAQIVKIIKKAEITKKKKDNEIKSKSQKKKTKENKVLRNVKTENNKEEKPVKTVKKSNKITLFENKVKLVTRRKKKNNAKKNQNKMPNYTKLFEKGKKLYDEKNYLQAVAIFKEVLKLNKNKEVFVYIYKCYKNEDNMVLLKGYIVEALKYYKEDLFFNKVLGILNFKEKNYIKALERFNLILRIKPDENDIITLKGLCYFHLKKFREAIHTLINVAKNDSRRVEAYYYIGLCYDNLREYRKALYYYKWFSKSYGLNDNYKHKQWIERRIILLERSVKSK